MAIDQQLQAVAAQQPTPTRWCLRRMLAACSGILAVRTLRGLLGVLRRLKITRQRARGYVHSPDEQYESKLKAIQRVLVDCDNEQRVVVFADELTYYNQPSVAPDYALEKDQPKARQAVGQAKSWRIMGCLNPFDGRLTSIQRGKISVAAQVELYQQLRLDYPQAQTIYVVMDNWPMHYHPDLLAALVTQQTPFALNIPKSWQGLIPKKKYKALQLPIQLIPLPTYASWLNPIEKVWKYLKKEVIHNHRFAHSMEELKARIQELLAGFGAVSPSLLSYCGLKNPKGIYTESLRLKTAVS